MNISRKFLMLILIVQIHFTFAYGQTIKEVLTPATGDEFSVVVIADTQDYTVVGSRKAGVGKDSVENEVFDSQTNWIVKNIKKQNIVFATHAGDVVDINEHVQWRIGRKQLDKLHGKVPYGISLGNHDMEPDGNSLLYQQYFPVSRFKEFPWYGGDYKNNTNSYQLISVAKKNFLFLHIECNATDSVLFWADSILKQYKDRDAIIITHMFLGPIEKPVLSEDYYSKPKGVMRWHKTHGKQGNSAQQMWEKCFSMHRNIKMILCGDQSRSNALHKVLTGIHGNEVHALLSDYSLSKGGALRIYRFMPEKNKVQAITFNTTSEKVISKTEIITDPKEHAFNFPFNF